GVSSGRSGRSGADNQQVTSCQYALGVRIPPSPPVFPDFRTRQRAAWVIFLSFAALTARASGSQSHPLRKFLSAAEHRESQHPVTGLTASLCPSVPECARLTLRLQDPMATAIAKTQVPSRKLRAIVIRAARTATTRSLL